MTFDLAGVMGNTKLHKPLAKVFNAVNFARFQSRMKVLLEINLFLCVLP